MGQMLIDEEFRGLISALSPEEAEQLEANLKADGCRDPLVLWDATLVDGHNRYSICTRLGIKFRTVAHDFADRNEATIWIVNNQLGRRNLLPFVRAELALKKESAIMAKAKANQRLSNGAGAKKGLAILPNLKIHTRKELAKSADLSERSIHKARKIVASAPEPVKQKLRTGQTTIDREYQKIVKAERKAEQVEQVKAATLPVGKFHVIVADPPWSYSLRPNDSTHRAANPYPPMDVDAICAMPVSELAHDSCILWLWTTNAFMQESYRVAKAWGFEVKTILTWAKDRMGTGDWLRGQTEHCLMAVRGKPVTTLTNQTTLLNGQMREHSRKPEEFYALVEALCPGTKLEMFSRQVRSGWDSCGAEVSKFAETAA